MAELNAIYSNMLKEGHSQFLSYEDDRTLKGAQNLESYATYLNEMNEKLVAIMDLIEKFSNEFLEKDTETRQFIDLNNKY